MSLGRHGREGVPAELTVEIPSAHNRVWTITAALLGAPWLAVAGVFTVWYLGWGMPDGWLLRVLIWIVMMALTAALHALALLSLWGTVYSRTGTETVIIDSERITVTRRAGRVPLNVHIRRGLVESAVLLPERSGHTAHPRIEVKAWRSAIRFGAGFTSEQAEECVERLNAFFDAAAVARHVR